MAALPGRPALERRVAPYLALIGAPPASADAVPRAARAARELYRLLLGPFAAELARARRLLVVPDGLLHYLPFESLAAALDAAGRPRHLLDTHEVAYAPAASVAAELARRAPRGAPVDWLAYGAPRLGSAGAGPAPAAGTVRSLFAGRAFADLPHARREVQSIARLFPEASRRVRLGGEATERALKQEDLARFRILHLATHGVLDDRTPGRSGLLLAPGHPDEDGLLQGVEVLNLHLDAELVVLSACQSGLGTLVRGEGLVGLSRAFFYAGARRLVVSLWTVNDHSTSELMRAFYARLRQGQGPAAALREAKRAMVRSDRPAYRFPYYWAPFVVVGGAQ
jgi:CHAT domain-containing protein